MGGSESKINYETVDRTDPSARAQGERRAQEENEERMRELRDKMEKDRELALREAKERALYEDEAQRMRLDKQRREREENERRLKEEEAFLQLKRDLLWYDFQICPRIRKESFTGLHVDDVDLIRIALIGPTGSGKTSFVGTLQRALGEAEQSAFEQGTGSEGTILLEEYYVHKKIRMIDTRGFFESDERLLDECLNIMSGRIRPGEEVKRNCDGTDAAANQEPTGPVRGVLPLSRCAHAVVFVVKANDPRLKDGKYKETLKKIREHFRKDGYAPVTVITYLDKLKDKEDKDEAFDQASWATGSSSEKTYFIANYTHAKAKQSDAVDRAALDILDSVLLSAERFIRIRKQREKNKMEREIVAGGPSLSGETTEQFLARLQHKHHWSDQGKMKTLKEHLKKEEINTVKVLKEMWEDIKSSLPLSIGMKIVLEEEMQSL
ncbi:uncharacterized protein [Pocillopora verrucosa]|uniref:uncharacterized protein n=1 Tax=Pocillopora verrucosa TaxID=203993 RepID=UPI003341CB58